MPSANSRIPSAWLVFLVFLVFLTAEILGNPCSIIGQIAENTVLSGCGQII
jgi:hypothetical protein